MNVLVSAIAGAFLPTTLAWGAAGHEIVATIAQIHLHPEVKEKLCTILPPTAHCHLAPVAAWADQVRRYYPETGPMHYVNPKEDHPSDHCTYGENGWYNEDVNVLTAIMNKTEGLANGEGDISLRFLIHFLGDLHQPLHLTGRDKGGNGALFRWEGRARSLHSIWDSGILTKKVRELGNYTTQLPNDEIEAELPGAIYDPYVRFIVWESIREWWRESIDDWLACPAEGDPYPHSSLGSYPSPRKRQRPAILQSALNLVAVAGGYLPESVGVLFRPIIPAPPYLTEGFNDKMLASTPSRLAATGDEFKSPACPYTWSRDIHALNCDIAWPEEYTGNGTLIELDTDEYVGRLWKENTMEKLFAKGGLRLAKIINEVIGQGQYPSLYFPY